MRYRKFAAVAIVAIGLAGCGGSGEEAATGKTDGQAIEQDVEDEDEVEDEGGTTTVRGVRMSTGKDATMPADFPKDLYLPGSYKLESVIQSADTTTLGMTTGDAVDKLFADTVAAMKHHGWTQGFSVPPGDDGTALVNFKKDARRASISVDDRGDEDTLYTIETGASRN